MDYGFNRSKDNLEGIVALITGGTVYQFFNNL